MGSYIVAHSHAEEIVVFQTHCWHTLLSWQSTQNATGNPAADGVLSVSFTDLRGSQPARTQPLSGIFTTVCDASTLTADPQATRSDPSQSLQATMAGASALVMLLTRADNPARTEASLRALLGAAPAALKVPLVLLTTALDLHQGVQQWLQTLPGKLPHYAEIHANTQTCCLGVHLAATLLWNLQYSLSYYHKSQSYVNCNQQSCRTGMDSKHDCVYKPKQKLQCL